jgi:hypothetical protein
MSKKTFEESLGMLLNHKKRDKLSLQFFTNQINYKLDLTPIIA